MKELKLRPSEIELLIILNGLYSEGKRTISLKELKTIMHNYQCGSGLCEENERPKWYWEACDAAGKYNVYDFANRLKSAVLSLEKRFGLKYVNKNPKFGVGTVLHLQDFSSALLAFEESESVRRETNRILTKAM